MSKLTGAQNVEALRVHGALQGHLEECVAVEAPLQISVRGLGPEGPLRETLAVTMRTPGHDEALAVGFLCGEGIVRSVDDVRDVDAQKNCVEVTLSPHALRMLVEDLPRFARHGTMHASCGVCGKKSIAAVRVRQRSAIGAAQMRVPSAVLCGLSEKVCTAQPLFDVTGGIHAAALFDGAGNVVAVCEDVGRHNALDKLIGDAALSGRFPLHDCLVWVSGRTSFELVQKAALAAVPCLASVGAPSSLAVELARQCNMTLVGFLRPERFNVYAGAQRIMVDPL